MSWLITGTQKIDPDAAVYLSRVEAADGQVLEAGVQTAVDQFVLGCKADGIWPAIKASCILAGARTLAGALIPLVGAAPTNVGFIGIGTDYVRKTGLVGNGSTKHLDSNRNNNADPQNSKHLSVYVSSAATSGAISFPDYIGAGSSSSGASNIGRLNNNGGLYLHVNQGTAATVSGVGGSTGLLGVTRNSSSAIDYRVASITTNVAQSSQAPISQNIAVFADLSAIPVTAVNGRLAFYSIGENLDLALLDTRVTALINAFGTAIP